MRVIVIGGGPSGMMAAIRAAELGDSVTILEKMNMLGKKLLITGKGRCNITSSLDIEEFVSNVPGNGMFLHSSFKHYTNIDLINFFEQNGLKVKTERGNRIFPITDKSMDVLNVLLKRIEALNIKVITGVRVKKIITENNEVKGVEYVNVGASIARPQKTCIHSADKQYLYLQCDKVIIATGGKSYPLTGSTGDGYELAKELGHTVIEIKPSLVPLETYEIDLVKSLQGLSLKNIKIKFIDDTNKKEIYEDFGEMVFTHFGVSGPTILSGSAHLLRYKGIKEKLSNKNIKLVIDLKPALDMEKLDLRIRRDFEEVKNKQFKNSLDKLLPKKLIDVIVSLSKINPDKKVNELTKEERLRLVYLMKNIEVTIKQPRTIEEAIITAGGINIKEINPSTMESKLIKNVYFAGEIIDVDAYTGGFNLQIAFSTGFVAGGARNGV